MRVSVIIPVYNAERYLENAVESAVSQPETGEVILVEDCSPDNSLEVCNKLVARYKNVRLLQHEGGENRGAGISRNLGIENAAFKYIAFLDADDYYLENRFSRASEVLSVDPSIDGVYEAIGSEFETKEAEDSFYKAHAENDPIATITKNIHPDQLFHYLVVGGAGYFHLDGFVVKTDALKQVGMLPGLRLHQDAALCIKLAAKFKLCPGEIKKPVAMRRLHGDNRITNPEINFYNTRYLMFAELRQWIARQDVERYKKRLISERCHRYKYFLDRGSRRFISAGWHYIFYRYLKASNAGAKSQIEMNRT